MTLMLTTTVSLTSIGVSIEQIQRGELRISDLQPEVLCQLVYNILPGGNTVLQRLAHDNESELIALFKILHPDFEDPNPKIHIPFIPNQKKVVSNSQMHCKVGL